MKLLPLLLLLSGCSLVKELHSGNFPYAVAHHSRVVGIQLSYQGYGLRLGFCSDTMTLLPCSTNGISAPTFSDQFKLGQAGFDTSIVESLDAGWSGQPPQPRFNKLFEKP